MKKIVSLSALLMLMAYCAVFANGASENDPLAAAGIPPAASQEKLCALTFDDGPRKEVTPLILDTLDEYGVKATFFMLGNKMKGNADIIKRIEASGHEIGCHTWDHGNMVKTGQRLQRQLFAQWKQTLNDSLGHEYPVTLLRPPGGNRDDRVDALIGEFGCSEILWSLDSIDWDKKQAEITLANIKKGIFDGAIILMHDRVPATAEVLPAVIEFLQGEGYRLVTVTELLSRNGETPVPGQRYRRMEPAA